MDRRTRWASTGLALLVVPVAFIYAKSTLIDPSLLYQLCGVVGSLAILVGVRLHRPSRAFAWYLLAAGNLMWVAGDLIYFNYPSGAAPFPSYADVVYLAAYPLFAVGLVVLSGGTRRSLGNFIDACIVATSVGLAAWVFLMDPYATDASLTMSQKVVSIAYPVGDLLLLATVCWFFFNKGRGNAALSWLLVSTVAVLVSDAVYGIQVLEGTNQAGWADVGFLASYLAFGAAALHPSMKAIVSKEQTTHASVSRGRLAFLAVASILGPSLVGATALRGTEVNLWLLAGGTLVLFLLTFLRIAGLMRSVERNASLLEAQGNDLATANEGLKELQIVRSHLMEAVHDAGERERSALALDLHDGPIQTLTTLAFEVDIAMLSLASGERANTVDALQALEDGLSTQVQSLRSLMTDLRPPSLDERGLVQALADLRVSFMTRTKIECQLELHIPERPAREAETILYRIAQEALNNVAKHSHATCVKVECSVNAGAIEMVVADDGIGFDASMTDMSGMDGHLGLASIRERVEFAGGICSIGPAADRGTCVSVTLGLGRTDDGEVARIAG